ncbi:MAG: hypothetical protein JWR32_1417 [Mycobacterium sp.]|jgi:hypothetical protein|nr:hypothetical protein [Mycobacterium sp.]
MICQPTHSRTNGDIVPQVVRRDASDGLVNAGVTLRLRPGTAGIPASRPVGRWVQAVGAEYPEPS